MTAIPDAGKQRGRLVEAAQMSDPGARYDALVLAGWETFALLGQVVADLESLAAWAPPPSCRSRPAGLPDMDALYLRLFGAGERAEDGDAGPLAAVAWQLIELLETVSADLAGHRAWLHRPPFTGRASNAAGPAVNRQANLGAQPSRDPPAVIGCRR
jgi:hypothetical protein